jgi:hypothetical protein
VQTDVMENEQAVVKLVVMDGIVMDRGIVLLIIVLETWKMSRVEFSAQFIAYNMEQSEK